MLFRERFLSRFSFSIKIYQGENIFSIVSLSLVIMGKKTMLVPVQDITFMYSIVDMIDKFHHGIRFCSIGSERDVIMGPFLKGDMVNMHTSVEAFAPYFYVHLSIIHELCVFIPFTSFEMDFLTTINFAHSHIIPNVWGILKAFQIVCCSLGMSPVVGMFIYFLRILFTNGWVTLFPLHNGCLIKPFAKPYEGCNYKFVWVRGKDRTSPVTAGEMGDPFFVLSWSLHPPKGWNRVSFLPLIMK